MRVAWKAAAASLCLMFAGLGAQAQQYKAGSLTIENLWARPTAGPNMMGAAYLMITNSGAEPDTLKAAASPDAAMVEVHEHIHDPDGVMRMRPVEGGVTIPAGGMVMFQPGGYHLMLMGLSHNLEEGQAMHMKLTFAHAGDVEVDVQIKRDGGMPGHGH